MTTAYQDDLEFLEGQFRLLDLRIRSREASDPTPWDEGLFGAPDEEQEEGVPLEEQLDARRAEHARRLAAAHAEGKSFALERLALRHGLDPFETELLLLLLYKQFGDSAFLGSGHALLSVLARDRLELMRLVRALRPEGRLRRLGLMHCDQLDGQHNLLEAGYELPPEVFAELTGAEPYEAPSPEPAVDPTSYRGYLELWFKHVALLDRRCELLTTLRNEDPLFGERARLGGGGQATDELERQMARLEARIAEYGRRDPEALAGFPLERVAAEHGLAPEEKLILVILLRNSLGLCDAFMGCDGKKLLALVSRNEAELIRNRALLYASSTLRQKDLVRGERGWPGQNFLDSEYDLPEPMIRNLLGHLADGADAAETGAAETGEETLFRVLEPRYKLDDCILEPDKRERLVVALQQEEHRELIFERWGFSACVPAKSGLAILLSGPPGTGKTMLAEAIAHHLGQKLFIADYSQVQNLFVGETEKRIVNAFRQAREADAVLVWDEADAMFYTRDIATHSWENRDVNVILQEIERHPGVVVLTTNRKHGLDQALDRRMGLKLELGAPGPRERALIWRRHLPASAPLADDVDPEALAARYEVSGGQIRNAALAAARTAAARAEEPPAIRMADLVAAIEEELAAGWSPGAKGRLGF